MAKNRADSIPALADHWSAPATLPIGEAGRPLICLASTYTFHASFFESELLPRFLGLKFDETEGSRPFIVERELALATAAVRILVDADHYDPSQTTLRWDQLSVRVPGGVQHSKVVLLFWENCARLIVSSANLTRSGYRRNREIAGAIDFYDHEESAPRRLMLDAIGFLQEMTPWVRSSDKAKARLQESLEDARSRVRSWRNMLPDFKPLERPRVAFAPCLPRQSGDGVRSPLAQMIELWGTRRATEITVMTPFVGDLTGPIDPVIDKLMQIPRARDAEGYLVIPGRPSESNSKKIVVGLPRRFLEAWATAWKANPDEMTTFIVPQCRQGEKVVRDFHAKGVLVSSDDTTMLLCGSSNFSPHGMGISCANTEANLCYIDDYDTKRGGLRLEDRLPVDWEEDYCENPIWPDTVEPIEDEELPKDQPLPNCFLWAIYNQCTAVLTVAVDPAIKFPTEWSLRWPGERSEEVPPLADHVRFPSPPQDGRMVLQLHDSLKGANISGLRLLWTDNDGKPQCATLPVHIESGDDLLPPEEFRSLTAEAILECLISGREPAEWVDTFERQKASGHKKTAGRELESLHAVDTSSYIFYRTRRFGAALGTMGQRLLHTVRTRDAMVYRLRQDPLGPLQLAEALMRESSNGQEPAARPPDPASILFSLAEIKLLLAYVARRIPETKLRPLFSETIVEIDHHCSQIVANYSPPSNFKDYLGAVKGRISDILEGAIGGLPHAS